MDLQENQNKTGNKLNPQRNDGPDLMTNSEEAKENAANENIENQSWFRRNALPIFVFNFSLLQLIQMTFVVYYIAVVRTIEKRYGLASTSTGVIMSLNDVVHISVVVFVGYFGRKGHKPLIIGFTTSFLFISALLYASPYFIYGAEDSVDTVSNNSHLISKQSEAQLCEARNNSEDCTSADHSSKEYRNNNVFYILCLASALNGFGGCALQILGMSYVDQNAEKTKSAFYLGIVTSTFALGPICGIMLGALCVRLPENLQPTEKTPEDPTWIGAWWLGYVICSVLLFILTIPMFFFPKHIKPPAASSSKATGKDTSFIEQIKEFPKVVKELLSNKAYLCMLVTGIMSVYVITGVFINMPKYFEIHYHMPAFKANIGAALPGMAGVFGGFIGGSIMTKFKFDVVDSTKMVVFSLLVTALGIATAMFITCPQISMSGDWSADNTSVSLDQACNSNCSCHLSKNTYHPVCGADGMTHYSPCYAGCTSRLSLNGTTYYEDCTCMAGRGEAGACAEPCTTQFYAFSVTMLLMAFLSSLGRVPGTVVQFRIVGDDEGSFALGITSFMINLLGFIPGPILFGSLVDSTCVLWQTACGRRGACLFYDTNRFRYKIFGVSLFFEVLSVFCCFGLLWAVKRLAFKQRKIKEEESILIRGPSEESELYIEKVSGV